MMSVGAVKFEQTGIVMYFQFDGHREYCFSNLYATEAVCQTHIQSEEIKCNSPHKHEKHSVHIMTRTHGAWWGEACRYCKCLTDYQHINLETHTDQEPAWSPWLKLEETKYNIEIPEGFNFSDWLEN